MVLQPRGVELLCPNPGGVGRTLVCNVTGSIIMRIDVSVRGGTSQTVFYTTSQGASNAPTTLQGVMVSVLTSSSSRLTAQLVLPDQVDLLPVSIECSDGRIDTVLMYSLKYMGKKFIQFYNTFFKNEISIPFQNYQMPLGLYLSWKALVVTMSCDGHLPV